MIMLPVVCRVVTLLESSMTLVAVCNLSRLKFIMTLMMVWGLSRLDTSVILEMVLRLLFKLEFSVTL